MSKKEKYSDESKLPVVQDKSRNRPGRPTANSSKENSCFYIKMPSEYASVLNHLSLKEQVSMPSMFLKATLSYLKTQHGIDIK